MNTLEGFISTKEVAPIKKALFGEVSSHCHSVVKPQGTIFSSQPIIEKGSILLTGNLRWLATTKGNGHARTELTFESLVHEWLNHGESVLDTLDGEFVFIVWDVSAHQIWAVRDLFGSMPLYYASDDHTFTFANQARTLWKTKPDRQSLNHHRILDFIIDDLEHTDQVSTFKENVWKVPIGGITTWTQNHCTHRNYWKPNLKDNKNASSENTILEEFHALLHQSIEKKLEPSRATALLLSGGLDSNAVLASLLNDPPNAAFGNQHLISLIPEKEHRTDSESKMLLSLSTHLNCLPHHWVTPSNAIELLGPVETFVHALEDPFGIHTLSGPAPCFRMAQSLGISQVMDGMDGDLVAGAPAGYWSFLWKLGKTMDSLRECHGHFRHEGYTNVYALAMMIRSAISHSLPFSNKLLLRKDNSKQKAISQASEWAASYSIQKETFTLDQIAARVHLLKKNHHPSAPESIEQCIVNGLKSPMLGVAIDRYRMGSEAFGVQSVHPLLDRDLVEFLLQLPWKLRVNKGAPKQIFRKSLKTKGWMQLAAQKELGHVGPWFTQAFQSDYLRRHPNPKPECLDAIHPYVNARVIEKAWKESAKDPSNDQLNEFLWRMIMLGEWMLKNA